MKKNRCEFCGEMRITTSTIFNGEYCEECYEVVIEHSSEAIKEIKALKAGG